MSGSFRADVPQTQSPKWSQVPWLCSCLQEPLLPLCSLEISSLNKTIRITAKSTKRIREALQPVLGKYGVSVEQALLRRVSSGLGQPLGLGGALGWGLGPGAAGGCLWAPRIISFGMGCDILLCAGRDQWVLPVLAQWGLAKQVLSLAAFPVPQRV